MLTILPQRRARIPGTAALVAWKAAERLMARTASHLSSGNSSMRATCWMPALLTRMSTAELFGRLPDHPPDLGRLRHVGARVRHPDAVPLHEIPADLLDLAGVAEAVQHHVGAGAGQRVGDAEPDAARRA